MADPFEVRMRFTAQLQHLNASVTSSQKAAQYALKYKDMDEDLHSCILEQLEKNSMNNRANIMYFLEHLADLSSASHHPDYIRMLQRDILRVVDAVAPEDGSGAANVKIVRKVLQALQQKNHLLPQTVAELEECLASRSGLAHGGGEPGFSSPVGPAEDVVMGEANGVFIGQGRLDKKLVEQRIEEDRERHKRLREHQWAIPFAGRGEEGDEDAEFDMLLDETSSVGSDDYRMFEEEYQERKTCALEHQEEMDTRVTGDA